MTKIGVEVLKTMEGEEISQPDKAEGRNPPREPAILGIFGRLYNRHRGAKRKEDKAYTFHQENERTMASWSRRVGWFTGLLVFFSGVGEDTKRQIGDSEITQRAAIVIGGMKEDVVRDQQGKLVSISFIPIIVNSGNTQTKNMEFVMIDPIIDRFLRRSTGMRETNPPDPASFFNNTTAPNGKYVLGPKVGLPKIRPPLEIGAGEFGNIISGNTHYYYGAIRYKDVFNENTEHITKYCFSINNFQVSPSGFAMDGPDIKAPGITPFYTICSHWNCADDECKKDEAEYANDVRTEMAAMAERNRFIENARRPETPLIQGAQPSK